MAVKNWTGKSQRSLLFYSPDLNYRIDFIFTSVVVVNDSSIVFSFRIQIITMLSKLNP